MAGLNEVFGVSASPVRSYVPRRDVDQRFAEAIESDKHIIVFGASKQGKSSLVARHAPNPHLPVSLTKEMRVPDLYHIILRKAGARITKSGTTERSSETSAGVSVKGKVSLLGLGSGEAGAEGGAKAGSSASTGYENAPVNLELPENVASLLLSSGANKWVVLENFHYLDRDTQQRLALHLRAFQELGVRFIIIGAWREQNLLTQFNGDLVDRQIEIAVEPWTASDFRRIVALGSNELNVSFSARLAEDAIDASCGSVGVFQELLKGICKHSEVTETQAAARHLDDPRTLQLAIDEKIRHYGTRHVSALAAISTGSEDWTSAAIAVSSYLPHYLVRVVIEAGFEAIAHGMPRRELHERMSAIPHPGYSVTSSDLGALLSGLASLQGLASVTPPVFEYDQLDEQLHIIDSTLPFFLKAADRNQILGAIPLPPGAVPLPPVPPRGVKLLE